MIALLVQHYKVTRPPFTFFQCTLLVIVYSTMARLCRGRNALHLVSSMSRAAPLPSSIRPQRTNVNGTQYPVAPGAPTFNRRARSPEDSSRTQSIADSSGPPRPPARSELRNGPPRPGPPSLARNLNRDSTETTASEPARRQPRLAMDDMPRRRAQDDGETTPMSASMGAAVAAFQSQAASSTARRRNVNGAGYNEWDRGNDRDDHDRRRNNRDRTERDPRARGGRDDPGRRQNRTRAVGDIDGKTS